MPTKLCNSKGEKVTAKAHGGAIDIQGVTVATVNDKVQLQSVRTWFDPMDMFRQIAPNGAVKKEAVDKGLTPDEAIDSEKKVEIDQKPRPLETSTITLPDRTVDSQQTPTQKGEAGNFLAATGCPFAGTDLKKALAPFPPAAEEASQRSSEDSEWSKFSHPNLPLSDSTKEILESGEQEGADQDPYLSSPSKS